MKGDSERKTFGESSCLSTEKKIVSFQIAVLIKMFLSNDLQTDATMR